MTQTNPFPGLRPFESDEDHLYFGREKAIDELLRRLQSTRFVSVVGTSGSGKSSLVRSGLIPSLQSGFMVTAGSSWRVATTRPGEDPIGHLASALSAPSVLGTDHPELASTSTVLIEATLRRGARGLVDAVRQAWLKPDDNLLVIVDQFEELFRFRRSRDVENSRDESIQFVKLLLEATEQQEFPIYVVLTMRSDFIGDCVEYPGLPEAVNDGQFLVPRLTRDELRSAITGPIAVGGGAIAPRLVLRLLNEIGDDQDQLPVLQHALMRTWDFWARTRQGDAPIDIAEYEAIGTMTAALSLHADEAYEETGSDLGRTIAERLFKALTDTFTDTRGVRRPTSIQELAAICEVPESAVIEVVEIFRRPGRSFLTPPSSVALTSRSIVDVSHESLMRCWTQLIAWAEQERAAAAFYLRLSQAASWFEEGAAGLWRNPELELGRCWREENHPTRAWASRYDDWFDRAIAFLDRSQEESDRLQAEQAWRRKRQLRQAYIAAGVFGVLFAVAGVLAYLAFRESVRATGNLQLAKDAVDQTLSSADIDPARTGADLPEMQAFRRDLLLKARNFYEEFLKQDSSGEELRRDLGYGHIRLGHINRMLGTVDAAAKEYRDAIEQFTSLLSEHQRPEYQQALATSYNWLGETLRVSSPGVSSGAAQAYDTAVRLQEALLTEPVDKAQHQQELARTHYNRGILRATAAVPGNDAFRSAEKDFLDAIGLLAPLTKQTIQPPPALDLARAYNNLGNLLAEDDSRLEEARTLYEQAVGLDEELSRSDSSNRQYKVELATFSDNLASLLVRLGQYEDAQRRNEQALALLDALAIPPLSLAVEHADAHTLRAQILEPASSARSVAEYEEAVQILAQLARDPNARRLALFHVRFGDLLLSLASWSARNHDAGIRPLLSRAMNQYIEVADQTLTDGSAADAQVAIDNVSRALKEMRAEDRATFNQPLQELQDKLTGRKASAR